MGLDGAVTGRKLCLTRVEEFQILLQDEEMLRPVIACQGGDDVSRGCATPMIPMLGEPVRVALASHHIAQDAEAR